MQEEAEEELERAEMAMEAAAGAAMVSSSVHEEDRLFISVLSENSYSTEQFLA